MSAPEMQNPQPLMEAPRRRTSSISLLLAMITILVLVPTFVLTVVLLARNQQAQLDITSSLTLGNTRSISAAVDREVDGMLTTLKVLSTSGALEQGNMNSFHQRASVALEGSGSYLLVIDPDMQQLMNTRVPFGTPLPKTSDPEPVRNAFARGEFLVSDIFLGAVAQQQVFNVILPIELPDGRKLALVMTQNVGNLRNSLAGIARQDDWQAALLDSRLMVAASTKPEVAAGQPFPLVETDALPPFGRLSRVESDGEAYLAIAVRSIFTGWYVVAWAPEMAVSQPLWDSLLWLTLGALGIGAIITVCIVVVGGYLARAVRRLARDARLLGEGELVPDRAYPISELAEISTRLSEAAAKRKQSETEVHFLMRELAHRAKNQLSVIQSMVKQTAQSAQSFDGFAEDFQRRIFALSRSTDLMLQHGASGISLKNLIDTHLEPFCPDLPERCRVYGPDLQLSAEAAQTIGMAMHELATNATKYGAFREERGRVEVTWKVAGDEIELTWREQDVALPEPAAGAKSGFGTLVLDRLVSSALNAHVDRVLSKDGIQWTIRAPLKQLRVTAITPATGY